MPYPAKTDRQAILSAAFAQVEREGIQNMSVRGLAASLELAPNALYRYFADRAALESAIHAETARRLHQALQRAVGKKNPEDAIRSMARTYRRFAREHRHLCEMMAVPCVPFDEDVAAHDDLWEFVVSQVARITSEKHVREASVALWAHLQGTVALEAGQVFSEQKPARGIDFGLEAWLHAAQAVATDSNTATQRSHCS
jgi:AcrR family transcriptional regulator